MLLSTAGTVLLLRERERERAPKKLRAQFSPPAPFSELAHGWELGA